MADATNDEVTAGVGRRRRARRRSRPTRSCPAGAGTNRVRSGQTESVNEPAKVLRIGSMVKTLLDEVRSAPLDEKSRVRLREIYEQSIHELSEGLSPDLVAELDRMALPFDSDAPERRRAAHRPGAAGRVARGPVPRDPGDADVPADGGPGPARGDAPAGAALGRRVRRPDGRLPLSRRAAPVYARLAPVTDSAVPGESDGTGPGRGTAGPPSFPGNAPPPPPGGIRCARLVGRGPDPGRDLTALVRDGSHAALEEWPDRWSSGSAPAG